jgi:hypothetical protein
MNDSTSVYEIIRFPFDRSQPSLTIVSDWIFVGIIVVLIIEVLSIICRETYVYYLNHFFYLCKDF